MASDGGSPHPLDLETVFGYIRDVRTLLLDRTEPFRYSDDSLLVAFNMALLEGRRLRPDLFVHHHGVKVPQYQSVNDETVPIEPQFRLAFVYGTSAHALARDQEDVQDQRSNSFMGVFHDILIGVRVTAIAGATPGPGSPQK
jgi:hypothetical protein